MSLEYHCTNGTKKTKTMGKLHEYQKHDTEILIQVFDDTTSKEQNEIIKKSLNADDIVDDDFLGKYHILYPIEKKILLQ